MIFLRTGLLILLSPFLYILNTSFSYGDVITKKTDTSGIYKPSPTINNQKIDETLHTFSEEKVIEFNNFFYQIVNFSNCPGIVMAIATPEKVLIKKTYGEKKVGSNDPIDENTIFKIASLSKGFTTALTLKIAENNIINLNDSISQYLPNLIIGNINHTKKMTIQHLLSHTTGAMPYSYESLAYKRLNLSQIYRYLKNTPIICNPGKSVKDIQYQNLIYSLISLILNKATGNKFDNLMRDEVLYPLNMNSTILSEMEYQLSTNKAVPHKRIKGTFEYKVSYNNSYYYNILPAGGISSNLTDMIKWLQAIMKNDNKILSSELYKKMFTPIVSANKKMRCKKENCPRCPKKDYYYGLGWYIREYNGHKIIFHGGMVNGFESMIAFSPEYNIGIVIMTNHGPSMIPNFLKERFFNLLFHDENLDFYKWKEKLNSRLLKEKNKEKSCKSR